MATLTQPHRDASDDAVNASRSLAALGITPAGAVHWNLVAPQLVQAAVRRGEGELADMGPFVGVTSPHTGRSPNDKFVVREPSSEADVDWGKVNQPLDEAHFDALLADVQRYLSDLPELFVQDLYCGADPAHQLKVRYVLPNAWHAQFVRNMFIRPDDAQLHGFEANFTVLHAPEFHADPAKHGTRTGTFIVVHIGKRMILIGGTRYAGELKKSMFTIMNYLMPKQGVLSMHCSANVGESGDTALFFGLSGTGKTTLSADPHRALIGDDEHGWAEHGVFNYEGGCYAKVIHLSPEGEPDIYATTQMFGTVLENVVLDEKKRVRFDDQSITENTRASYPIHYIRNHVPSGRAGHPKHVVFLTADAFGVLPPIAKLTPEQAMYYFLSGYTAKVAGTERGVTEPQATFSACFGAVFLVWHPTKYAEMLGEKLREHGSQVWLVNTGWSGGAYGVGKRMKLAYTRAMVRAAIAGQLDGAPTETDPVFGLAVPTAVPGVPAEVLRARDTWADAAAYDAQARKLAEMFAKNIAKFGDAVPQSIRDAGPRG
ncbi:Phosphoenolpyruvate carboxykinase [ATP] [Gemmatirosa kalamazoonensis]|uniref:Phosphoenolpyruvate carboxykinase (ATP) n=1 Tax=Gemmatirosa kalamazoonensis TaxID=861299 RepID=W0RJQ5_9BACT|nr:phosphoenolpyruvate carboxykinase (ATP) [Gemmatirosa kalamazoonensis]AHG91309.1 Phosphoenolpyruvate carboxykinase [ATP] [Gemmatirosa kalamazoonensis]